MKDPKRIIKILFIGLAILLVAYFMVNREAEKRYHWTESYNTTSNQPYGTLFIQKLLASYRPGQKFTVNDKLPLHKILDTAAIKTKTDYVFIGQDIFLDHEDINALLTFIASGNDAFIATINLPLGIVDSIFISECNKALYLSRRDTLSATLNFYNHALKTEKGYTYLYRFGKKDMPYFWNTLSSDFFCDSTKSITPLGYIHPERVNFFRLPYGKGHLYIHTNPIVFTNYFLTKPDKVEYSSSVFSHLQGQSIIWDEFSKSHFTSNNAPEINPLSYIIQHESLRYAWWLMLASILLYVLFTAKRKQRIIPVLEEKGNTSLEFVQMISALHFENGNHRDIAQKKMKYFFHYIKVKYNIHTQTLSELFLKRLHEKSKVELEKLKSLAQEFYQVENDPFYDIPRLVDLHNELENFYKHCK